MTARLGPKNGFLRELRVNFINSLTFTIAYEEIVAKVGGKYSVGDEVSLADAFLIP